MKWNCIQTVFFSAGRPHDKNIIYSIRFNILLSLSNKIHFSNTIRQFKLSFCCQIDFLLGDSTIYKILAVIDDILVLLFAPRKFGTVAMHVEMKTFPRMDRRKNGIRVCCSSSILFQLKNAVWQWSSLFAFAYNAFDSNSIWLSRFAMFFTFCQVEKSLLATSTSS